MIHIYEKVPKTESCPYGIKKVKSNDIFLKPCVVTLIAVPNHLKDINGSLRCVAKLVNPDIDNSVDPNRRIYGFGYGKFDEKSGYFSGRLPYQEDLEEFIETYMKVLFVKDNKRIDVYEAMKNIRNITFLTYCNADTNIIRIQNHLRDYLKKYGYSKNEIDLIYSQMCIVSIASRNLGLYDLKSVLFNFADVTDKIAIEYQDVRSKLRDGTSWDYEGVRFANLGSYLSCITFNDDDHALYRYMDYDNRSSKLISAVLNTSLNNAIENNNSDTFNPITYQKIIDKISPIVNDINEEAQRKLKH